MKPAPFSNPLPCATNKKPVTSYLIPSNTKSFKSARTPTLALNAFTGIVPPPLFPTIGIGSGIRLTLNSKGVVLPSTDTLIVALPGLSTLASNLPPPLFDRDPLLIVALIASAPLVPPEIEIGLATPIYNTLTASALTDIPVGEPTVYLISTSLVSCLPVA